MHVSPGASASATAAAATTLLLLVASAKTDKASHKQSPTELANAR